MIVEYIRYRVTEEEGPRLLAAYREAKASLEASPHCLAYELARCAEDATSFVLRIEWDSVEGHMVGFRKGPHFPAFYAAIAAFVPNIEEMRHYERTEVSFERP